MNAGDEPSVAEVVSAIREAYTENLTGGLRAAEALQEVAIRLQLSLRDCAEVVGQEDLVDAMGDSWEIVGPEGGPYELRRPGYPPVTD